MKRHLFFPLALAAALGLGSAHASWFGATAEPQGFGVYAGSALVGLPLLGTVGLEGAATALNNPAQRRFALGVTWRDLGLPGPVQGYGTLGLEFRNTAQPYLEAGLHGSVLGPAGWRAYARANAAREFSAGLGLELRF